MTTSELNKTFDALTHNPLDYLDVQDNVAEKITYFLKELYDSTKSNESKSTDIDEALPELIIKDFDEEQIWQELELQNSLRYKLLVKNVQYITNEDLVFLSIHGSSNEEIKSDDEEGDEREEQSEEVEDDEDDEDLNLDKINDSPSKNNKAMNKSIVDDEFFKLSEMENFLLSEEKLESTKDKSESNDDDIDMFENLESSNNETDDNYGPMYDEFFVKDTKIFKKIKENKKSVRFSMDEENSDNDELVDSSVQKPLSSLEKRSERINKRISQLEEEAISERPWALKGEVTAKDRPQNSLLEEAVEFDVCSRPAPIITEETTVKLEDIIRQRIKDKAWDDVERKIKSTKAPQEFKKQLILNQEKSKESLSQIYEKEFVNQREAANPENKNKPEEEPKEHKEIDLMIKELFRKLDALTNYHYTPKQAIPELKIVNNLPAISMEEVAPTTTTDASLLAPEEIQKKYNAPVLGKEERTDTDKKRERRKKKHLQHKKRLIIESKTKEMEKRGIRFNNNKGSAVEELKRLTSSGHQFKQLKLNDDQNIKTSKDFFSRLQDQAKSEVEGKRRSIKGYSKNGFKRIKTK